MNLKRTYFNWEHLKSLPLLYSSNMLLKTLKDNTRLGKQSRTLIQTYNITKLENKLSDCVVSSFPSGPKGQREIWRIRETTFKTVRTFSNISKSCMPSADLNNSLDNYYVAGFCDG